MPIRDYFAGTYSEARQKFLDAAHEARGRLTAYTIADGQGPHGEPLSIDVARLGPDEPDSVLLLISATHARGLGGPEPPYRWDSTSTSMAWLRSRRQCRGDNILGRQDCFVAGEERVGRTTLRSILKHSLAPSVKKLAVLDFHTGLGPMGYGEPIYLGPPDEGFERAKKWYGPEVTSTLRGTSASAAIAGALPEVFLGLAGTVEVTYLALEYGTLPIMEVLTSLRADHWLHAVPDRQTPLRGQIERQMRNAFYVDTPAWKAAVYGRAADFVVRAARALASS